MEKNPWRYYHFTHVYHKWPWYMAPEIWSVTVRIFCHFENFFCPFTPLKTWKIKILKKWIQSLQILPFYTNVPKIMIICYTVPEIWYVTDVIVIFHLSYFLPFLPSKLKKRKKHLEISPFYICVPKIIIRWCKVPEILCMMDQWTDGQTDKWTDGWTEKVTYSDGWPT